MKKLLLIFN